MAKTIGKFAVNIGAVTTGFSKGLDKASKKSQSFSGGLKGMIGPLIAIGGAVLAARKAFGAFAEQFDEVDKIAKFSAQTGVATEGLIALHHAGGLAGVGAEQVNKGVQKMTVNLGKAKAGSKAIQGELAGLGVSMTDLQGMTPDQQFQTLAGKIGAIEDPAKRADLAMKIFGKSGLELIPMFKGGAAAIESARIETEQLGMSFSAVDAAKIEEANDAWARVKMAGSGVVRMFAIHLAPAMMKISSTIVEVAKVVIEKIREWEPVFTQVMSVFMTWFDVLWESVSSIFNEIVGVVAGPMASVKDIIIDALIGAEFAFKNLGPIVLLVFKKSQVAVVSFGASIAHFFTGVLPALFNWFVKNWDGIWRTALDFALTVFVNLGKNIRAVFSGIWDFIKTGKWDVAFTPITEGFSNMIRELPEIPERQMGPLETSLRGEAREISADLNADFEKFRIERREQLLGTGDEADDKVEMPDLAVSEPGGDQKKKEAKAAGATAALQRGSAATFSAISKQIRGAADKREVKENKEANKRTADATERVAEAVENLAPETPVPVMI